MIIDQSGSMSEVEEVIQNKEGLTFAEWIAAAAKTKTWDVSDYHAWQNGEDPTEHRQ